MVSATEALQAAFRVSASEACRHAMGVPHLDEGVPHVTETAVSWRLPHPDLCLDNFDRCRGHCGKDVFCVLGVAGQTRS